MAAAARRLLFVRLARRSAAARNTFAAFIALAVGACPAWAESGGQNLVLPLVTAIALASAASHVPRQVATIEPGHRPLLSLLPSQVQFEDGYELDVDDYMGRRSPVGLLDADRIGSVDIVRRPRMGWTASAAYDVETRGPLAGSEDVLRLLLEYRF
jgi:hypothetical protein